jgi:excisionase family DNA binding protein
MEYTKGALTTKQLADFVGVHQSAIRRYIHRGTIKAFRQDTPRGPVWLITAEEVERFTMMPRPVGRPKKGKTQ